MPLAIVLIVVTCAWLLIATVVVAMCIVASESDRASEPAQNPYAPVATRAGSARWRFTAQR